MRITSGEFRGRNLLVPKGDEVRPTQDRVREALFSMLGSLVEGANFLDLFAGSGAVGLEALSRGARLATFVELSPRHVACLEKNIANLKAEARTRVVRADVYAYLSTLSNLSPTPSGSLPSTANAYDLVFADPPYALGAEKGYADVLKVLVEKNVVVPGGYFVTEMRYRQDPESSPAWELCRDRTYGQTRLAVYRRLGA